MPNAATGNDRYTRVIVVMGVAGAGKSTVGKELATRLGLPFADGDDFHPESNVARMAAGHPLTDADRAPWLHAIGRWLADREGTGGAVVACSALKRTYREVLREHSDIVRFLHLAGTRRALAARIGRRRDHFMPPSLLDSQLADLEPLEPDESGATLDVTSGSPDRLAGHAARLLRREAGLPTRATRSRAIPGDAIGSMTSELEPGELGTILGVWAHPDDEAYLMAGTALLAARAGSTVACVTATVGEAGESADEERWPRERLAEIRRDELAASLAIVGIEDHTWLDFPDGGLAGFDRASGVERVAEVVERVQPDTILTFGPDGMTGHSDHITIGEWALEAARTVRGERCRVLAATKTPEWLDGFAEMNTGILGPDAPRTPSEDLAARVGLADEMLDVKMRALQAQASQTTGLMTAMGESTYRAWAADEFWVTRRP